VEKNILYVFILSSLLILCPWNTGLCGSGLITLTDGNRSAARIITPDSPSKQVQSAAKLLSDYVYASTGARLPIVKESYAAGQGNKINIWLGQSSYVMDQRPGLDRITDDGFLISFPDDLNIIIAGLTDWGTEFGAYEFLERFVGVRWLLPGTSGEHVRKLNTLRIPTDEIIENPAFGSRLLSGLRGEAQTSWARRNRMHGQIKFHHNLLNLFPADKYRLTHPEFFPMIKGRRYLPYGDAFNWQPCFSAAGSVEEAIKNICEFFALNPDEQSYSLGINDSHTFCQCELCLAKVGSRKNFLNRPDYSGLYYEWANRVVEGVLKKYPDKWFGCLAYNEVAEPPAGFKLNPRLVPFMTYDRMKWVDPDIERQGKELTERWADQASQIGWYDYIYGTPYLVPRVYFHKMAEYYSYAKSRGVRAMYAEAYPNWGEGPKLYVALRLQWDPDLDVDALLNEWYRAAVGEKSAEDLAAYYSLWEDFWTNRVKKSAWFAGRGAYLKFTGYGYLELVTYRDIEQSRRLLESVAAKAETQDQKERAGIILRAFEYYEASVIAYLGLVKKQYQPGMDKAYYKKMDQKRKDLVKEFEKDPVLIHPIRFDKKGIFNFQWDVLKGRLENGYQWITDLLKK